MHNGDVIRMPDIIRQSYDDEYRIKVFHVEKWKNPYSFQMKISGFVILTDLRL